MERLARGAASLLVGAAIVAGCGQKGPLYLPDQPGSVITRPAPGAEPPEAEPEVETQRDPGGEDEDEEQAPPPQ